LDWHDIKERERAADLIGRGYGERALASALAISDSTAEKWIYSFKAVGREAFLDMGSKRREYDYETKLAAVLDFTEGGMTRREVMAKYGIPGLTTLGAWVSRYRSGGPEELRPKPKGRPPRRGAETPPGTREQELERRIQKLEAENAYLKKSMALKAERRSRTTRRQSS
jgi:transposase